MFTLPYFASYPAGASFARHSGGHLNPVLSLAAALSGHLTWFTTLIYIVAQVGVPCCCFVLFPTTVIVCGNLAPHCMHVRLYTKEQVSVEQLLLGALCLPFTLEYLLVSDLDTMGISGALSTLLRYHAMDAGDLHGLCSERSVVGPCID